MKNNNVITNSAEFGLIPQRDFFDKDIAVEGNTDKYFIIEHGDFVYNPRKSSTAPYGPFNCYQGTEEGIVSPLYTCLKPLHPEFTDFLLWYFRSSSWHSYIYHNGAQGGARHDRVGMTNDLMDGIPINLPCRNEQKKICDFLSLLDRRLTLQRKMLDALKSYKRGAIKQIWASELKSGWICDKICNLGDFRKGAALSKADICDEGLPMILYGELYTTYTEVITSVVRKTKSKVDDVFLSRVGDVIMPTSGETPEEISTASCVMQPGVILAGDLLIYRSSCVDGRMMSYALNHIINDKIARIAQGKSIVHVQGSEIGNIEITLPPLDLQTKYAKYLDWLSQGIIAEEKCYEQLLQLKNSLLQQMFV